jgi:hypothetical protein
MRGTRIDDRIRSPRHVRRWLRSWFFRPLFCHRLSPKLAKISDVRVGLFHCRAPSMHFSKFHLLLLIFFVCCLIGIVRQQSGDVIVATRPKQCSCEDDPWPRANRFVTEYRPEVAARLKRLSSANASADDPEVIRLARDFIVKSTASKVSGSWIKHSMPIEQTPQAARIDELTRNMVNDDLLKMPLEEKLNKLLMTGRRSTSFDLPVIL